jgi:hypothetical protein
LNWTEVGLKPERYFNHDTLRPYAINPAACFGAHASGGELEQILFLLGYASVQTTERYLGCKQRIPSAVNDHIGIEPEPGTGR